MSITILKDGDIAFTTGAYIRWDNATKCWIVDNFDDDTYYDGELVCDQFGQPYTDGELEQLCPHCHTYGSIEQYIESREFSATCNCHGTPHKAKLEDVIEEWQKYVEKEEFILKNGEGAWLELHPEGHEG